MATVTATPDEGVALTTFFHVACADVPSNDTSAFDADVYPTEPELKYVFKLSASGEEDLTSPVFSTNAEGIAQWDGILIPAAGTWALDVVDTSDDSVVATTNVVVS